jgi:hypothetical protein
VITTAVEAVVLVEPVGAAAVVDAAVVAAAVLVPLVVLAEAVFAPAAGRWGSVTSMYSAPAELLAFSTATAAAHLA